MPKASRNAVTVTAPTVGGHCVLTARVTAALENSKANGALIQLLSKTWKIPKSALSIRTGASSWRKVILVVGCGVVLQSKLNDWIADHD
jgi:uncharacterized protein YggU (UPF0235/DUF167 family)